MRQNVAQTAAPNAQMFKRPLNEMERASAIKRYKHIQRGLRSTGILALVFPILLILVRSYSGSTLDQMSSLFFVFLMIVIALTALSQASGLLRVRKALSAVLADGNGIVVRGIASRNNMRGQESWSVGPVAVYSRPGTMSMLQEGMVAEFTCIAGMRAVVSINGNEVGPKVRATVPKNLEALFPMYAATASYPSNVGPQPAPVPDRQAELAKDALRFCPTCGTHATGLAFCSNCGYKM